MIELPEKWAADRLPWRALPGSAQPASPGAVIRAIQKGLASKPYREHTYAEIFEEGLRSRRDGPLATARRDALTLLTKLDAASVASADVETLAVAEAMANHMGRAASAASARHECASLAPLVAAARSLTDAVKVGHRTARLELKSSRGFPTDACVVEIAEIRHFHVAFDRLFSLRHTIASADDEAYARARDAARELREGGGEWERARLDLVFPDEPWATEDLARGLDEGRALVDLAAASRDAPTLRRLVDTLSAQPIADHAFALVCLLEPHDATPLLARALERTLERPAYGPVQKTPPRRIVQALACLASDEATAVLAPYAAHPIVGPQVVEHLRAHPELASSAAARGKSGAVIAEVLAKRRRVGENASEIEGAEKASLPILRERPWRKKETTDASPIVVATLGDDRAFVDEALLAANLPPRDRWPTRPMTEEELAQYVVTSKGEAPFPVDTTFRAASGGGYEHVEVPSEIGLALFNEGRGYVSRIAAWVKKHGLAAVPGVARLDWLRSLQYDLELETFTAVRALVSPRIAPSMARAAQRKRVRRTALAWLAEHAEIAAFGLVPVAVGPVSDSRRAAESALRELAHGGHGATVRTVAQAYGPDVATRIDALLAGDPLALGAPSPKPPAFLRADELPPVRTRAGTMLDAAAIGALLELMQVAPIEPRYAGVDVVAADCDPESLSAFARELVEQWVLGDAPGRAEWMLEAAVWFPSPAGDARIAALAREWAQKNAAKAGRACAALARIGSDVALMHLAHIAESSRFEALRKDVRALVAEAASARGLSADELEDRTVPDGGLGAAGTTEIVVGSRAFVAAVDASGAVAVRERAEDGALGAPMTALPRPRKTDDAKAFAAARARLKALADGVTSIVKRQSVRLERAMVAGRTWDADAFEARLVRHPIVGVVARGLLWERVGDGATSSLFFRIAEDGSYADGDDVPCRLGPSDRVRVAHPARSPERVAAFATLFADYRVVQPFEQLGRVGPPPSHPERVAASLALAAGHVAPAVKILGVLEARGWQRTDPGAVSAYLRILGDLSVRVPLTPGFSMDALAHAPPQTIGAATVARDDGAACTFAALDDVSFFEVGRDLEALRRLD